jgi:hypothetical protein
MFVSFAMANADSGENCCPSACKNPSGGTSVLGGSNETPYQKQAGCNSHAVYYSQLDPGYPVYLLSHGPVFPHFFPDWRGQQHALYRH